MLNHVSYTAFPWLDNEWGPSFPREVAEFVSKAKKLGTALEEAMVADRENEAKEPFAERTGAVRVAQVAGGAKGFYLSSDR